MVAPRTQTFDADSVRRAYARWARIYDAVVGPLTALGRGRAVEAASARVDRGARDILEVGVGSGLSLPAYDRRARVTGIDLSREMLALARRRRDRQGLGHVVALEEMDAGDMRYPDGAFATTVVMYVMSVVPDPGAVLRELARVTAPGGEVIVVNHFAREGGGVAWCERQLERLSALLGWHSAFPRETMLAHPHLELIEERGLGRAGIYTLMRLRRTG